MNKRLLAFAVVSLLAISIIPLSSQAQRSNKRGFTISTHGKEIGNCGDVTLKVDDLEVVRSTIEKTVSAGEVRSLQVSSPSHGGMEVIGWDREEYSISACLAVAAESASEAQTALNQISLSIESGKVLVKGPGDEIPWMAYLIIHAPRSGAVELEATNGPIGVIGLMGKVNAKNINGPVTLRDVSGEVVADVVNGPIDVYGHGGDFKLDVRNGPLTVTLGGNEWRGQLEGHTTNGPLILRLPPDYQSSVRVDASRHSPTSCKAPQCEKMVKRADQPNRFEFGDSEPVVRLSTVNGPVNIKSTTN